MTDTPAETPGAMSAEDILRLLEAYGVPTPNHPNVTTMTAGNKRAFAENLSARIAADLAAPTSSTSPAGVDLEKACEPWKFSVGDPPDWDSPLHQVFVAGMIYSEGLLAQFLNVKTYEAGDGSEDFDQDATKSLVNILTEARLYDSEDGTLAKLASPAAGGVATAVGELLEAADRLEDAGDSDGADEARHAAERVRAATRYHSTEEAKNLREAMQEACDLLKEKKHGSPARPPGHNARLILESALDFKPIEVRAEDIARLRGLCDVLEQRHGQDNTRFNPTLNGDAEAFRRLLAHLPSAEGASA